MMALTKRSIDKIYCSIAETIDGEEWVETNECVLSREILNWTGQKQLLSINVEALDCTHTLLFRLEIEYKNS
jgi:hypothetical protein